MKKGFILGMVLVVGAQMSFAAPGRDATTVRKSITEEVTRSRTAGESRVDLSQTPKMAESLQKISGLSLKSQIDAALKRTIKVTKSGETKTVSLMEIGALLVAADTAVRTSIGALDAAGTKHLKATEEAIKTASAFLASASRTSESSVVLSDIQKLEVAAFNKQISLISDMLTTMDTVDLQAHTEVMKKALEAKLQGGDKMNGDQAFATAMGKGVKSETEYKENLKKLEDCV